MRLARAVKKELGSKPGIRYKKQLKAHWTHSGGNRVVIARLRGDRGGTVEVWLDRFADGKVPRFQYGIGAKSERRIKEIEEAAKSAVGYAATRRVDAIDTGTLMKMDPPLDDADFGHPVLECYDTDEAYFGVYHDSPRNTLPAIGPLAKKAAAFLSAVTKAVREHDRDLKSGDGVGEARVATDAEQEEALLAAVAKREGGQRFNLSTKDRKALEDYGMVRAEKWLAREYPRFDAKDVHQRSTCDFECTFGKERFLVEVKCTQTAGKSVFLTRNQVELVKHQGGKMILLVVSGVTLRHVKGKPKVSGGKLLPLKDWQIASKDLVPVTYSYRLPK